MARTRRRRRYVAVFFVVLAAGACLALGYWQWGRYESMAGTYQNLGYALQWPLFAAFCIYGYRRFVKLEDADERADDPDASAGTEDREHAVTDAGPPTSGAPGLIERIRSRILPDRPHVTEIPADLLPPRASAPSAHDHADPALDEYNDYLARLDERATKGRGR